MELLRAAAGEVRGKISYNCGSAFPRANADMVDMGVAATGQCPWWFYGSDLCEGNPNPERRLCQPEYCPLWMRDPDTKEDVGCIFEADLLPHRRFRHMTQMLEYPLREKTIYIDRGLLPSQEHLCNASNWDPAWKGRIVAFDAPDTSTICTRPDYAIIASQVGVKAWLSLSGRMVHGTAEYIDVPVGNLMRADEAQAAQALFKEKGVQLSPYTFELEILYEVPPLPLYEAPPKPARQVDLLPHVSPDTASLTDEPAAVAGLVLIPLMVLAVVAKVYHGGVTAVPLPAASGVPLSVGSSGLSLSLATLLVAVTFSLVYSAGQEAADAQRDSKGEVMRFMQMREETTQRLLSSSYLKTVVYGIQYAVGGHAMSAMRSRWAFLQNLVLFHNTWATWGPLVETMKSATSIKQSERFTTGIMVQVLMENGFVWDEQGLTNDHTSPMTNGTQALLNETNLPLSYGYRSYGKQSEVIDPYTMERSVVDPLRQLFWWDLPGGYTNIFEWSRDPLWGAEHSGRLYVSEYQVSSMSGIETEQYNSPYWVQVHPVSEEVGQEGLQGLLLVAISVEDLYTYVWQSIQRDGVVNPLRENMTFSVFTEDGIVMSSNAERYQAWRHVDLFGPTLSKSVITTKDSQRGFQLFTVKNAQQWQLNALAHMLEEEYGTLAAKDPSGEVLTRTFRARDYYNGYRTELLWLSFDGTTGDVGWHQWDTWLHCADGGTGCYGFEQGRVGRALRLDGTGSVRVSPYLTTRVPRVAQTRVGSDTDPWRSTVSVFNRTAAWGGVADVVVTQRNPRPSVQGEDWRPVARDRIFSGNDYAVSFWMRRAPAMAGQRGVVFADSLTPDSNIRIYDDGALLIRIVSFGCRTAGLADMPLDEWVFVTAVARFAKKRTFGSCAVYVNGVQRTKSLMATFVLLSHSVHNLTVGHNYVGLLDEVRVHNQTLSPGMVSQLMRSGDARYVPDIDLMAAVVVDDPAGLHTSWVCAVMVPQEDIVRSSQEYGQQMEAVIQTQNSNTDKKVERQTVAAFVLIAAALLFALLLFITFNSFLTQPFALFAREITLVSQIDLDNIQHNKATSLLQEINVMKRAMYVLVENMRTYKSFMPMSMQQTLRCETELSDEVSEKNATMNVASAPSDSFTASSLGNTGAFAQRALALSLGRKNMSFLVLNVVDFHNDVLARDPDVLVKHASYIVICMAVADKHRGIPETFSGDRMLVTFNGARTNTSYRLAAGQTGVDAVQAARKTLGLVLSAGATSGPVQAGHIGADAMKRYTALSPCVSWVHILERYARWKGYSVVADPSIVDQCATSFVFRHCGFVTCQKAAQTSTGTVLVSELVRAQVVAESEWMYQLEEAGSNEHTSRNNIFKMLCRNAWSELGEKMSEFKKDTTLGADIQTMVRTRELCGDQVPFV